MSETKAHEAAPDGSPPLARGASPAPGYEVIELLSRGRRLDVYDAWSAERLSRCVLKLLRPERRDEQRAREKLLREGELLCMLTHPNIVRGYETITDPHPIVVMETLGGETLSHLIECRETPLSAEELAHLGLHLASAIAYLHRLDVLHLDLKPHNVVAEAGRARLIDLSLVREPGPAPGGIGTWCYLAPEQARGGELGPAADVWGIGVTLFEAATGQPAFDDPADEWSTSASNRSSGSDAATPTRPSWDTGDSDEIQDGDYPQLDGPAPPVASVRELPKALAELIDACMAADPADRPATHELLARLEPIAGVPTTERRHG